MTVGVLAETAEGEKRVALTPEGARTLKEKGFEVVVQAGAGEAAGFSDASYADNSASLVAGAEAVCKAAAVILKILGPIDGETERLQDGSSIICLLSPTAHPDVVTKLNAKNVNAFALELVPRITRAQRMDVLSSMSTIAGYKASLIAADKLPKFFPMFMTAAGTIPPAKALIIGAGVAGLQAIATCRRLGALVEAFDVRPAVKEQVESLGARFVEMNVAMDDTEDASGYAKEVSGDTHNKELELIASRIGKYDVVITTALIPGRPAPVLITEDMVKRMQRGSVIVDLAAPNGGNCESTVPGQTVVAHGVTIVGNTDLLSQMAYDASLMFSRNIIEFLLNLAPEGQLQIDLEDQIIRETLVTYEGKIHHEPTRLLLHKEGSA